MSYTDQRQRLLMKYPAIQDLERKAKKRIPQVGWHYLQTGTSDEHLVKRNLDAFQRIVLTPKFCMGELSPRIETALFGRSYSVPFGMAPVGLTGLMWPRAEVLLAQAAQRNNFPYTLSTLATETPETVGPHVGEMGWFQLYTPREKDLRGTLLKRAKENGFHTLLITADVPLPSRRERTKRAGMSMPAKITPRFIWQGMTHPTWTINTLKNGLPRLRTVETYSDFNTMMSVGEFVQGQLGGNLSWDMCKAIRDEWDGPVAVKGLLHPADAEKAIEIGLDGIVVSNHGGRQFDGAPAAIEALPEIVKVAKGKTSVIFDSGIRTGLDIARCLALGADFVMLGRAFMYGVCALGKYGGDHVYDIIKSDIINNMAQLGVSRLEELADVDKTISSIE